MDSIISHKLFGVIMNIFIKAIIFFMFLIMAGCESNCVNDNGPDAGQCKHYPNIRSCSQVSPYHHSCTLNEASDEN